jgi:thimet oligopeptidase
VSTLWLSISGITCEWDFAEVPSQLFEEWGRDAGILRRFALNYQTNEPIPAELVARMTEAGNFGKGLSIAPWLFNAKIALDFHNQDPAGLDLLNESKSLHNICSPYPYEAGTHFYAIFTHLTGYSSMYYTYAWSLALSKDIFSRFQTKGLLDCQTARDYRQKILEPGGAKEASQMMQDFLGRDYSFEAFRNWLKN